MTSQVPDDMVPSYSQLLESQLNNTYNASRCTQDASCTVQLSISSMATYSWYHIALKEHEMPVGTIDWFVAA